MIEVGAILSFLGGSAFRLIWEQLVSWLQKRQDHKQELELMRLQGQLAAIQFEHQQQAIKLQAEMGVKVIEAQRAADESKAELEGWAGAVRDHLKPTGIWLVDLWNGVIRPAAASIALGLWVLALQRQGWTMSGWDRELVGVILGFFFATRVLTTRR